MDNKMDIFKFEEKEVRTHVDERGEIWFVAKDVCDVLGLGNSSQATSRLREKDLSGIISNDVTGRPQSMRVVSEFGLYELVLSSRKEDALRFKYWVCDEVLPSIRKTGGYNVKPLSALETLKLQIKLLEEQEIKIKKLEAEQKALTQTVTNVEHEQEKQGIILADMRDGADFYAITAYHKVFLHKTISNEDAKNDGFRLAKICKGHGIQLGRSPHPIWGTVNTYPKAILDEYYTGRMVLEN